ARNHGLSESRGEWIVVLDSDDELEPGIVGAITALPSAAALVSCEARYFDENYEEYRPIQRYELLYKRFGRTPLDPFLWFDFYYHGIVARRWVLEAIGGYDPKLKVGEDQDVLLRALEAIDIASVHFLRSLGYHYRRNAAGVCVTAWPEVLKGYTATMLKAAARRGASFGGCRLKGPM